MVAHEDRPISIPNYATFLGGFSSTDGTTTACDRNTVIITKEVSRWTLRPLQPLPSFDHPTWLFGLPPWIKLLHFSGRPCSEPTECRTMARWGEVDSVYKIDAWCSPSFTNCVYQMSRCNLDLVKRYSRKKEKEKYPANKPSPLHFGLSPRPLHPNHEHALSDNCRQRSPSPHEQWEEESISASFSHHLLQVTTSCLIRL